MKYFLLISAMLFYTIEGISQTLLDTVYSYTLRSHEFPRAILKDTDQNYVFITSAEDTLQRQGIWIIKSDINGSIIWKKWYSTTGYNFFIGRSGCLIKNKNSGFTCFGSKSYYPGPTGDGVLMIFDSKGDSLHFITIGGNFIDNFEGGIQYNNGDYVMAGQTSSLGDTLGDFYIVRTDSTGTIKWQISYGTARSDYAFNIIEKPNGNFVVGGIRNVGFALYLPWVIEIDSGGNNMQVRFNYNSTTWRGNYFSYLKKTFSGDYFITGNLDTLINAGDDPNPAFIVLTDSNFNIKWRLILNGPRNQGSFTVKQISDSTLIFVGEQNATNGDDVGWIGKATMQGQLLWQRTYRHNNISIWNYFADFCLTPDSGFMITGSAIGPTSQDAWLVHLNSNGCLIAGCDTLNTAVEEIPLSPIGTFEAYPNPASYNLTIRWSRDVKTGDYLEVTDVTGRIILSYRLIEKQIQQAIDASLIPSGIYLCQLRNNNVIKDKTKIVISR